MQFTTFLSALLLAGSTLVVAAPDAPLSQRALCKKPLCTAKCPDGTPYDCCVTYIRDPCTDHYCLSKKDMKCQCRCPNGTLYLCNAQYFVDPCRDLTQPAEEYKE